MQNTSYNLHRVTRAQYNNLEPDSIEGLRNLYAKPAVRFSTSIPINKSSMELFGVTQQKDEFTRAYLKRFNEEMLKVEELLEQVALEALIIRVREHFFQKKLYVLLDKNLLKVKQVIENHIQVKEVSLLRHEPSCFFKDNQHKRPSK